MAAVAVHSEDTGPTRRRGVDYTAHIAAVRDHSRRCNTLLNEARVVACMGSRLALSLSIACLPEGQQLVGAATTEPEALQLIERMGATLLVCTDVLERGHGSQLVHKVKARWPALHTLMIVTEPQQRMALHSAMRAGCDGLCLERNLGLGTVLRALTTVAGGAVYCDRELAEPYLALHPAPAGPGRGPLSARECEVLQLAAQGYNNQAIAAALYLSAETVKSHISSILRKLQARDRTHAAVQALRLGLVPLPEPG